MKSKCSIKPSNSYHCLLLFLFVFLVVDTACGLTGSDKPADPIEFAKLNKSLYDAIYAGDVESVKSLILKGADLNAKYRDGQTTLSLARKKGRQEIVQFLSKHGANPVNFKKLRQLIRQYTRTQTL